MRYLDRLQPLGLLALRVILGAIMIVHGKEKVFGGMAHHIQSVVHLGLPAWMAYLSAGAELFGGILVLAGLFTRIASLAICIDMCVAIVGVHWKHGLSGPGGYQFAISLAAMAFALIFYGGGPIALDAVWRGVRGGGKGRTAKAS